MIFIFYLGFLLKIVQTQRKITKRKEKKLSTKKLNREKQTATFIDLVLHSRAKHRKLYWLQPLSVRVYEGYLNPATHTHANAWIFTQYFSHHKSKSKLRLRYFSPQFFRLYHYFFFSRKTRTCRQSMVACKTVIFVESARAEAIGIAPRHACVCRTKSKKTK